MRLSKTRFIRIENTRVALLAANEDEARLALKELRHKKKELLHHKRRLRRRLKAIDVRDKREARVGTSPEMGPLLYIGRSLGAVIVIATGWNPFPPRSRPQTRDAIMQDMNLLDEVLLNVNEAMLHIEGKLISA
jgi:hypothetical protein